MIKKINVRFPQIETSCKIMICWIGQLWHCHQRLGVCFLLSVKFENSLPVTGLHLWVCFGLAAYLKLFERFSLELNGRLVAEFS